MTPRHILIIGGSAAGMATAMALAEDGHRVTIFERDGGPLPDTPLDAFDGWNRRGVPHMRASHAFLARLRNIMRAECPGLLASLLDNGAYEVPLEDVAPETLTPPYEYEEGDDDLMLLACRRATFDWVLRKYLERYDAVTVRTGVRVVGVTHTVDACTHLPRLTGVRVEDEHRSVSTHTGDLVIDASGRKSQLKDWLAQAGIAGMREQSEHTGLYACSCFYKFLPGQGPPPDGHSLTGINLEYMQTLLVRGDHDIFSVTIATPYNQDDFRLLLKPHAFHAACKAMPQVAPWVDEARSVQATKVRGFGKLLDTYRSVVPDGKPIAVGLLLAGDAGMHANPAFGRGITMAFINAYIIRDCVRAHAADLYALAVANQERVDADMTPWYDMVLMQDRLGKKMAAAKEAASAEGTAPPTSVERFMAEVFGVAARTDPVIFRAGFRAFNMMGTPRTMMRDPDIMKRVMEIHKKHKGMPLLAEGPSRAEMMNVIMAAAA